MMDLDWARLPEHLLDLILEGIVLPLDYLHFSLVCRSWHGVAKHNKKLIAKMSTSPHNPPMLLVRTQKHGILVRTQKHGIWRFYNAMDDKVLGLELELGNVRFCGSSKGWLIVVEENTVTLINPFLRFKGSTFRSRHNFFHRIPFYSYFRRGRKKTIEESVIRLPQVNLHCLPLDETYRVFKATISADPISNTNGCIVAVIYEDFCRLAFIRLGVDTTWTYVDHTYTLIAEVVFVEDRFYAIDNNMKLLYFDITTHSMSDVQCVVSLEERMPTQANIYLLALNEREIWAVEREIFWNDGKRQTKKFNVFELDFSKRKWIKKKTLGDAAIFVGDNSSLYVLASECNGCQPNCIYFSHDHECCELDCGPHGPSDFGVYDVKNRCFSQPYNGCAMQLVKKAKRPPIWVVPKLVL